VPLRMLDWVQNALAGSKKEKLLETERPMDVPKSAEVLKDEGKVKDGVLLERMASGSLASALSSPEVLGLEGAPTPFPPCPPVPCLWFVIS